MKTRHWDRIGNGGLTFTELGFGTAPLGNLYRAVSDEDAQATLQAAWDGGFRYFDTAPLYGLGLSETRLNQFLRGKKRDEYRALHEGRPPAGSLPAGTAHGHRQVLRHAVRAAKSTTTAMTA